MNKQNTMYVCVICYVLSAVFAQGRLAVKQMECFVDKDLARREEPIGFCLDKRKQNLYILTKSASLDSAMFDWSGTLSLWKFDRHGHVVLQSPLMDSERNTLSLPIRDTAMALTQEGHMLVMSVRHNIEEFGKLGIPLPMYAHAALSSNTTAVPDAVRFKIFDEQFIPLRVIQTSQKLVPLDDGSLIAFRSARGGLYDVFLTLDSHGKVLSEKKLRREFEVCDFDLLCPEDKTIVVIGRERLKGGEIQYEYAVKQLSIEDGSVLKKDAFQGTPAAYNDQDDISIGIKLRTIEATMSPKILSAGDGTVLCFVYGKSDTDGQGTIRARRYSQKMELVWEKVLCEFPLVLDQMFAVYANSFHVAPVDDSRFLTAVNNAGRLRFSTFDFNGKSTGLMFLTEGQKIISLHELLPMDKSIIAITSEIDIPDVLADILIAPIATKIYTIPK